MYTNDERFQVRVPLLPGTCWRRKLLRYDGGRSLLIAMMFLVQVLHSEGSDDWILQIKYVQKRDNGTYECQVGVSMSLTFPYE